MNMKHILMAAGIAAVTFGAANLAVADETAAAPAAEAAVEASADAAATAAAEVTEATLADGTKIKIKEGQVTVVGADGTETPAPDGEHTLADGTKVKTVGGAIVEDAAPAAGEEPAAEAPAEGAAQ